MSKFIQTDMDGFQVHHDRPAITRGTVRAHLESLLLQQGTAKLSAEEEAEVRSYLADAEKLAELTRWHQERQALELAAE